MNKKELFEFVERFATDNGFRLMNKGQNEFGQNISWKSKVKESPFPSDKGKDMVGLQARLQFAEQLKEGGYGWIELSSLYIYMQWDTKKWIEKEGAPEGKNWEDYALRDPYSKDDKWQARIDFYRDRQKLDADDMPLFVGDIRNDNPGDRISLTQREIEQELRTVLEMWNNL